MVEAFTIKHLITRRRDNVMLKSCRRCRIDFKLGDDIISLPRGCVTTNPVLRRHNMVESFRGSSSGNKTGGTFPVHYYYYYYYYTYCMYTYIHTHTLHSREVASL